MINKPKKAKDWASTIALVFGLGIVGLIFANRYVENFPLTVNTFIFAIIGAVALFIGLKALKYASPTEQLRLEDFILYGVVMAGLIFAVIRFDIAPSFTIVVTNVLSMLGI